MEQMKTLAHLWLTHLETELNATGDYFSLSTVSCVREPLVRYASLLSVDFPQISLKTLSLIVS